MLCLFLLQFHTQVGGKMREEENSPYLALGRRDCARHWLVTSAKRVTDPVLIRSAVVVVGESGECGIGFPGHVGIGGTLTVLQDFDHTPTGHVEVLAGVAAMRPDIADEGTCEG